MFLFNAKKDLMETYGSLAYTHLLDSITASQIREAINKTMHSYESSVYEDSKHGNIFLTGNDVLTMIVLELMENYSEVSLGTLIALDMMGYAIQDACLLESIISESIKRGADLDASAKRWMNPETIRPDSRIFMQCFIKMTAKLLSRETLIGIAVCLAGNDRNDEMFYRLNYDIFEILLSSDEVTESLPIELLGVSKAFEDYTNNNDIEIVVEE